MGLASCKVTAYLSDSCLMILLRRLGGRTSGRIADRITPVLDCDRAVRAAKEAKEHSWRGRMLPQSPVSNYTK